MGSAQAKSKGPAWPRKIIHLDMDAFFAAVEQRDHPEYRGKPVVVGGDPDGRGVVSTASYEARPFGIRSAMPAAQAKRLCPQAIFLKPRFDVYQIVSHEIRGIFKHYTDLVEPASLDEAYLDVTTDKLGIGDPVMIATLIKQNIRAVTKLTASAGVAPNMFLAKIASEMQKPDGLTVIAPEHIETFLKNLDVRKIPGVGPVTEKELHARGIRICDDLAAAGEARLRKWFGKTGSFLYQRACGVDTREVEPEGIPKQYSTEETFAQDIRDRNWLEARLRVYAQEVFEGLMRRGQQGRTVVLKVKYFDFEQITRSKTLAQTPDHWEVLYQVGLDLLRRKTLAGQKAIRLLGIGVSGLGEGPPPRSRQGDLFEVSNSG